MVRNLIAGTAVAALFSVSAIAQTPSPATPAITATPAVPAPGSAAASSQMLAQGDILVSKLMGSTVYVAKAGSSASAAPVSGAGVAAGRAPDGTLYLVNYRSVKKADWSTMKDRLDSIGDINDIVIGQDGRVRHAVIGVGGFLGIGEKNVALDLREFEMMRDEEGTLYVIANKTRANLDAQPAFKTDRQS